MTLFADVIINRKSPAVDRVFTYSVPESLATQAEAGMLARVPFNREHLEAVVIAVHDREPEGFQVKEIEAFLHEKPLFRPELLELAEWISRYYCCSRAAALQAMLPAGMTLSGRPSRIFYRDYYAPAPNWEMQKLTPKRRALLELLAEHGEVEAGALAEAGYQRSFLSTLEKLGLVLKKERRLSGARDASGKEDTVLSSNQQAVFDDILREWQEDDRPYLLHGVTGSGKTEIYLRLIRRAAAEGKQCIVLVPEIALSTQMLEMLMRRLDLPTVVLHSGLKATERRQIWQDIAEGRIQVVVGARSAVFAPLPELGLIIVDEEQENSYKQDNVPRFSAIDTALKRCELSHAHLVLGSATPSVERYHSAMEGKLCLGKLTEHYHPAPLPKVEVVDMREELRAGHRLIFSRRLLSAMGETISHGGQCILFLNRRGYYRHFSCRDCGNVVSCPHCAVAMSYHETRDGALLKCHYCGRIIRPPEVCPECGSARIRHFGIGTQRVEDELSRLFPEARVARLDSDVMDERGKHEAVYRDMRAGNIDILVGTQMVAKGLDFPKVELAAVIAADTLLNLPDWRAPERTYQLITQLTGRAGRRDKQGLAIIQTYEPEAMPIRAAAEGDYDDFYARELMEREMHGYPPFSHLVRLIFTGLDQGHVLTASEDLAELLRPHLTEDEDLCGPADAPIEKLKDHYRRQIIIKTCDVERWGTLTDAAWKTLKGYRDVLLGIDVDPVNMM